ncbi:MAG: hypothetical protein AAF399_07950 [Bacteroidota bacterium]
MPRFVLQDEGLGGNLLISLSLPLPTVPITLQELFHLRVQAEVAAYNEDLCEVFQSLAAPLNAKKSERGFLIPFGEPIDEELQGYLTLAAFQKDRFLVFVDGKAIKQLDQIVPLDPNSKVRFVHLQEPWPMSKPSSRVADLFS